MFPQETGLLITRIARIFFRVSRRGLSNRRSVWRRLVGEGGPPPSPLQRFNAVRARGTHGTLLALTLRKQRERASASRHAVALCEGGFTLLELLIVIGIIALLLVLIAPAFTSLKSAGDVTNAAYTIKGVLDTARTYAKANNTYTWVGFFEEDISSATAGTPGTGRLVMSIVASKDGTKVYDCCPILSPAVDMDPAGTRLSQVGKLVKLDNMHLRTFDNGTGAAPADTFPTRPLVPGGSPQNAKIGDTSPDDSLRYFHYPATGTEAAAQYKFRKMIQFSPRGECRPQNDNYEMRAVVEVGLQPVHGTVVPALDDSKNCAVQLTGFSGNTKIYQR
jgi:prepilin-type N-terminal cleavage/methylation domain-containing protein